MEQYSETRYGVLYIFNYKAKDSDKYYSITKVGDVYHFVFVYTEVLNSSNVKIGVNSKNQIYLIYTGYYKLDYSDNSVILITDR